jgi:hypothetical protein
MLVCVSLPAAQRFENGANMVWFTTAFCWNSVRRSHAQYRVRHNPPVSVVRDLGVLLDSELSMKLHIPKVASCCFYQLRRLYQLNRLVGREVTTQLVVSLILSRLDYCNSLLAGLPVTSFEPLQLFKTLLPDLTSIYVHMIT